MLSSFTPPPAPVLKKAIFSDTGGYVVILFDSATNKAGLSSPLWPCNNLFEFESSALTNCVWLNSSAVQASFVTGTAAHNYIMSFAKYLTPFDATKSIRYLEPGSNVTLLPQLLQAECSSVLTAANCAEAYPYSHVQTVVASPPFHPMLPIVNLGAPPTIGCDNLTIDTSTSAGSGGRPWKSVIWTSNIPSVEQYLNTYGLDPSLPITVPNSMLSGDFHIFILCLLYTL